jgi:hypothetical protein
VLPCEGAPVLPPHAAQLGIDGGTACRAARGTSLRGRESPWIHDNGRSGRTLYLTLFPHFANVRMFAANQPPEKFRVKESRETADVIVRLKYAGGGEEEQYPLSVDERRHVLVNRKPALYALELDPTQPLVSAELVDRSAHM